MQRTPQHAFELVFTPRFPIYFVLGALALAVMGDSLSNMADLYLLRFGVNDEPTRLWWIFGIAFSVLGVLIIVAYSVGAIQRRMITPSYRVVDRPQPAPARGLIAFASLRESEHLEAALKYHGQTLEKVWLLATHEAQDKAEEIRGRYELNSRSIEIVVLADAFDLQAVREEVDHLYRTKLGHLTEADVIADFTGGTKPMSLGMIFACMSSTRRLEYVMGKYEKGRVTALSPVEYGIDFSMFKVLGDPGAPKAEKTL